MTQNELNMKLSQARKRVSQFDKIDGFQDRCLSTIIEALRAGFLNPDSEAQYDAFVMLEDVRGMAKK